MGKKTVAELLVDTPRQPRGVEDLWSGGGLAQRDHRWSGGDRPDVFSSARHPILVGLLNSQ
jgi:hypothetical protein